MPPKQEKPIKEIDSWTKGIKSDEIIKTTNMEILDDFGKTMIKEGDHLTSRKVFITQLPERKHTVDKKGVERNLLYMELKEPSGRRFSMTCEAIATKRSLQQVKIKLAQKAIGREITPDELDAITDEKFMEMIDGLLVGIARRPFETSYGWVDPLQFFMLDDD